MNYNPGWYMPPPQYPPYPPQPSGVVYVPIQMDKGGRPPKIRGLAKQLKEMFEVQELMKNGGVGKKEEKKPDGPKKPMIPLAEGLFLAVLLSPFIGLPTLYLYKMLFQMWGAAIGMK